MTTITDFLNQRSSRLPEAEVVALKAAKLVPPDTSAVRRSAIFEVETGPFNEAPCQLEAITDAQFGRLLICATLRATEFRQCQVLAEDGHRSLKLFHMTGDYGLAVVEAYPQPGLRFFKFKYRSACQHQWKSVAEGRCYHEAKCLKCGETMVVDSSD